MTKVEKVIMMIILVAVPLIFIFWNELENSFNKRGKADTEAVVQSHSANRAENSSNRESNNAAFAMDDNGVSVIKQWDMPDELVEISGNTFINDKLVAAIQDEKGNIYIYNLETQKIERKVDFSGKGDYEGIALVRNTAYVLQSDGKIFEVDDINKEEPKVKEYQTPLTKKHDAEGLCYDDANNRLLVAIKGKDDGGNKKRGVYAFSLKSKEMDKDPILNINLENDVFEKVKKKKVIAPSEIAIHPQSREIYILDGPNANLLILDDNGKITKLYDLKKSNFRQAEGMMFNSKGELFISNEGGKDKGNILKVSLAQYK